ncbi:hypothetical protein BHE74_00039145 [Ensete ventricosum]|nr:hypothetical protein GW17_00045535 [Ensete ventricosum]RWW54281.1 hypothetical protein BHE74_00039145 [Ensete ventricosum]
MRQHLVPALEDEALPRLPAEELGNASSQRRKTRHRPSGRTRRRLGTTQEDEAPPRLPAEERGSTSSQQRKTRRRLVFQQVNKAAPRPSAGRRGAASSPYFFIF